MTTEAIERAQALLARSDTKAESDALALKHALEEVLAELTEAQESVRELQLIARNANAETDRLAERNAVLETACKEARRKADDHRRLRESAESRVIAAATRSTFLHEQLQKALPSANAQQRLREICGDNGELTIGERVNQLVAAYDAESEMDEAREVLRARGRKEAPLPCFAGGCSCWKGGGR